MTITFRRLQQRVSSILTPQHSQVMRILSSVLVVFTAHTADLS